MGQMITRVYRNDSDQSYIIPGLGELHAGQRLSVSSEFPPPINLANYPGVVDVVEEEAAGTFRDYEKQPEQVVDTLHNDDGSTSEQGLEQELNAPDEEAE